MNNDSDDIRSYDPDDIHNDPKFGPMLRQIEALELPSAFAPADPDAPAEELPATEQSVVATGGRNNARAAVVAKAPSKRAEQPPDANVLVQLPEPADQPTDDEPPAYEDVLIQLPEGNRTARTRIEPIPLKPRRKWLWLLLLVLAFGIAWAAISHFGTPASERQPASSADPTTAGTTEVGSTAQLPEPNAPSPPDGSTEDGTTTAAPTVEASEPPPPSSAIPPSTARAPQRPSPATPQTTSMTEPTAPAVKPPSPAPKPAPPPLPSQDLTHP